MNPADPQIEVKAGDELEVSHGLADIIVNAGKGKIIDSLPVVEPDVEDVLHDDEKEELEYLRNVVADNKVQNEVGAKIEAELRASVESLTSEIRETTTAWQESDQRVGVLTAEIEALKSSGNPAGADKDDAEKNPAEKDKDAAEKGKKAK